MRLAAATSAYCIKQACLPRLRVLLPRSTIALFWSSPSHSLLHLMKMSERSCATGFISGPVLQKCPPRKAALAGKMPAAASCRDRVLRAHCLWLHQSVEVRSVASWRG